MYKFIRLQYLLPKNILWHHKCWKKYSNKTKYTLDFRSSWSLSLTERPTNLKNHVAKETLTILPSIHPSIHPSLCQLHISQCWLGSSQLICCVSGDWGDLGYSWRGHLTFRAIQPFQSPSPSISPGDPSSWPTEEGIMFLSLFLSLILYICLTISV